MEMRKFKPMTPEEAQEIFEEADILWLYPGKPQREIPHAELAGKNHSDGFIMVGKLIKENPDVRMRFAEALLAELFNVWRGKISRTTGADSSSTALAEDMAKLLGAGHIRMIKTEDESGKKQVWHPDNESLSKKETILHTEELVTTTFSAKRVRKGIRIANPDVEINYVPFLPAIVERSDPDNRVVQVENSKILFLLQLAIKNYPPDLEHCPYCHEGSQALRPKEGDNWSKYFGKNVQ